MRMVSPQQIPINEANDILNLFFFLLQLITVLSQIMIIVYLYLFSTKTKEGYKKSKIDMFDEYWRLNV